MPSYYDSYQENLGIDENEELVSDVLIYNQIQKLIFKNANGYSYKRIPPLADYYLNNKVKQMATILEDYFISIYNVFGVMFLYSSKSFRLMIEIFPKLYDESLKKKTSLYSFFFKRFMDIKKQINYSEEIFLNQEDIILDKIFEIA